ncbi:MAG TPA: hypothetical protein VGK73_25305 [Polyangiaceae bacterium]
MASDRVRRRQSVDFLVFVSLTSGCSGAVKHDPAQSPAQPDPRGAASAPDDEPSVPAWCGRSPDDFGPALVPPDRYERRAGAGIRSFAALTTSQAAPLEECGLEAALQRLAGMSCRDGQQPFAGDLQAAHRSRSGSTGPGGRCGSILDRYVARCSEATYDVYVDMYFCTEANADAFR